MNAGKKMLRPELILVRQRPQGMQIYLWLCVMFSLVLISDGSPSKPCEKSCLSGSCVNGSCVCDRGWVGDQCQHCQGRFKHVHKTKCTWLIEGYPNAVLRLRFNHFATECSWDHMYVYDGDSIYAPLVAVFSGLIVPEVKGNETVPEVETNSGYALLHFFSDAAYNLTGFEIFYSINSCPNNCSGHGKCTSGNSIASRVYCECDKYWKGEACDIPYCRNNCGSPDHGYCDLTGEKLCVCNDSWQGPDCSLTVPSTESYWIMPTVKPFGASLGRASHKAVVQEKVMWVVGGYIFNYSNFQMVLNYNLESGIWNTVPISSGPLPRYGHSLALYWSDIYMFGGKLEMGASNVTDELWVFNIPKMTWSQKSPSVPAHGLVYAVEGHSAHIVELDNGDVVMVVIFGYSSIYSYISNVQEYNIRTNTWLVPEIRGAIAQGGYGHSSVYDSGSKSVYVHGGYKSLPANKYGLVDDLYRYEVQTRTWTILRESGYPRYLHSSVLLGGTLLIFGGNTHNDTSLSNGAKCFSADFLAYDIACDEWTVLPKPNLHRDVNRFGHTAVTSNGSMYVFGGFSSVLLNDVLIYRPPSCEAFLGQERCEAAGPGVRCIWKGGCCMSWEPSFTNSATPAPFCPAKAATVDERCYRFSDCTSCTANTNGCQWCDSKKCISALSNCTATVKNFTKCPIRNLEICSKMANCKSCSLNLSCQWDPQQQECHTLPAQLCGDSWSNVGEACLQINSSRESYDNAQHYCKNLEGNIASLTTGKQVDYVLEELQKYQQKGKVCVCSYLHYHIRSSLLAVQEWILMAHIGTLRCFVSVLRAFLQKRDVQQAAKMFKLKEADAYGSDVLFRESERSGAQNCSGLRTCGLCLEQPDCGWCGDPSNTGRGQCMEGSYRGPMKSTSKHSQDMVLETGLCPKERGFEWAFIQCPACQCNGHSTCVNGSVCEQCRNLTTGLHCETCLPGYHGDPTNGGKCQACKCNGHANVCQVLTGKCFCTTKGIKGDQCQLCDSENRYLGNPLRGTCYYNLLIDYQFTFSLLQEDDQHYTAINFMATPEQTSKNLDMSINASNNFNLNITWSVGSTAGTISGEEIPIVSKTNIKEYRDSFSCEKFSFHSNPNITFYVYVSNFSWPIKIQIAFSQHNSIMDLVQFFVTFFSCFLSLLLVAAVVWKIKQTCWASRRREQLMRERQQMASRPFASVAVTLDVGGTQIELLQGGIEGPPKPVAVEPCSGGKAAVLTVLMCLPRGASGVPPPGQSGIAIASALIDTSQQKPMDFKEKSQGLKNRKALPPTHQGTCV
ncbi:attractin-like protein 1 [Sinocyclocheilus grahami]|uniref:attractin-like protein 1 n=1 Tax=Sinocyclocheilus grahami TaxID=75366 RepID=UPI0007AC894B|nr:PREDICTED: attractin-like protein 1 [Sinocyclocheilus grahami]